MKIKSYSFGLPLFLISSLASAQTMPVSLRADVSVDFVMDVEEKVARIAKDPVSGNFFYITSIGNVHEIKNISAGPFDTLLYTSAAHGIDFLQGMAFIDSSLFLIGNHLIDSSETIGLVKKAVLQPSGLRTWVTVVTTDAYAQSWTWYDHGFSGIVVSPDSDYIYISSGSRTDHGEEQNNHGLYPAMREVPLTSAIFRIPANSLNLILPNDSILLSPYLFADGTRNSFDLAFDANDNLFATENSGDRDDPDELNWIRQGKNYGFPWTTGGDDNPQKFPGYVPSTDALLNHSCNSYIQGYYYDDINFPSEIGYTFTPPIKNTGPDADRYRESSGTVNDGSNSGNYLTTFTPHRCPLGLSFDKKNILASDLKGDGFLVCFTRAGDSTGLDIYNYPGTICDPGQDLLHIELSPDGAGEYQLSAVTIVNNFSYPVDTYLDSTNLYVIEYSTSGDGRLFKVSLPLDQTLSVREENETADLFVYPNPAIGGIFTLQLNDYIQKQVLHSDMIFVFDQLGNCVLRQHFSSSSAQQRIDISKMAKGVYLVEVETENKRITQKIVIQ